MNGACVAFVVTQSMTYFPKSVFLWILFDQAAELLSAQRFTTPDSLLAAVFRERRARVATVSGVFMLRRKKDESDPVSLRIGVILQ